MNLNLNADCNMIFKLDLDPIKVKLMHKESGEGWSRHEVDAVEFEYRRFLCLMKLFPHEQVAPLFDVDIFWHYHILDTMKYAVDCEQIFGYFLHHFPYSGLLGEDDEVVHQRIGARMQELYETTFGEAYIRQEAGPAVTEGSQATTAKTAFSQPAVAKIAFSQPATPKIAFSQPAMPKLAFSQPAMPKLAFSQPARPKLAFSQPARPKLAFSQPARPKIAFSQPSTPKTAFSQPAITKTAFSVPVPVSEMAITAGSSQGQDAIISFNWVRPVLEYVA